MKNKKIKNTVWAVLLVTFVFYCFVLFLRLFVNGRVNGSFSQNILRSNLIPFGTVYDYIEKVANDRINVSTAVENLVGNLIAFFPMGCYLPCLFQRIRKLKPFCVIILGMLLVIELSQPLLGVGYFDIDDIILNFAGAIAGYGMVHAPVINPILKKICIYKL